MKSTDGALEAQTATGLVGSFWTAAALEDLHERNKWEINKRRMYAMFKMWYAELVTKKYLQQAKTTFSTLPEFFSFSTDSQSSTRKKNMFSVCISQTITCCRYQDGSRPKKIRTTHFLHMHHLKKHFFRKVCSTTYLCCHARCVFSRSLQDWHPFQFGSHPGCSSGKLRLFGGVVNHFDSVRRGLCQHEQWYLERSGVSLLGKILYVEF